MAGFQVIIYGRFWVITEAVGLVGRLEAAWQDHAEWHNHRESVRSRFGTVNNKLLGMIRNSA